MSIYVSGNRLASKLFNAFSDVRLWDFSWPRGVVNVKPAVVEPAVPDTAAADAGAKSAKPKVGNGCLRRRSNGPGAEAGPAPAAASSQSQCVGPPAPELPVLGSSGW
jgi:hypothetical protein